MNRIIDYKATGKTYALLRFAYDNKGIVVCQNPYAMKAKAKSYGFTDDTRCDFISYIDYLYHRYDNHRPVYIDELEECIQSSIGRLDGYTLSKE